MKILYIPFDKPCDLLVGAKLWQEARPEFQIAQHGTSPSFTLSPRESIQVYVLAHGMPATQNDNLLAGSIGKDEIEQKLKNNFYVQPNFSLDGVQFLDILEIARRMTSDFTQVAQKISLVELYFCNKKGTEKCLAQTFRHVCWPHLEIAYYHGTLSAANQNGLTVKLPNKNGFFVTDAERVRLTLPSKNHEKQLKQQLKSDPLVKFNARNLGNSPFL